MKSLKKYTSLLLIIPAILVLSGCDMPISFGGGDDVDTSFLETENTPAAPKAPDADANKPAPPILGDSTDNKKEAENKNGEDEIALSSKSATLDIDSEGRTTPFVPYRERNLSYTSSNFGDLPYPPQLGEVVEGLDDLVSAKVTGILFEPKSPSAIVNVLGDDYLVKPGDEIEGFKISSITKDYVAIQTGSNVYRAKVGDIVEGEMYGSGIYNLGHKFAGQRRPARKEDVLIVATKKQASQKESKDTKGFDMSLPPVPEVVPKSGLSVPKINLKTQAGEIPLPIGSNVPPPPGQSSGN